jgi:hypothetical protein
MEHGAWSMQDARRERASLDLMRRERTSDDAAREDER